MNENHTHIWMIGISVPLGTIPLLFYTTEEEAMKAAAWAQESVPNRTVVIETRSLEESAEPYIAYRKKIETKTN